jgi:hypothetical protein
MSYAVTLNHVRYGRFKFDLAELRRRLEARIAGGANVAKLGHLLVHTNRLMAMIDALDDGHNEKDLKPGMDAEFALLLLSFEHVQDVMAGKSDRPRRPARKRRALPAPKRKLPRQPS